MCRKYILILKLNYLDIHKSPLTTFGIYYCSYLSHLCINRKEERKKGREGKRKETREGERIRNVEKVGSEM